MRRVRITGKIKHMSPQSVGDIINGKVGRDWRSLQSTVGLHFDHLRCRYRNSTQYVRAKDMDLESETR